jgi:hypothetical protein
MVDVVAMPQPRMTFVHTRVARSRFGTVALVVAAALFLLVGNARAERAPELARRWWHAATRELPPAQGSALRAQMMTH